MTEAEHLDVFSFPFRGNE